MKYTVVSAAVTDEIHFADGRVKIVPGGAGIYALSGIKLWDDEVRIVTGIGKDYEELHGKWYMENGISMDGLMIKDAKSPYTVIRYFENGEREEVPRYGVEHFQRLEATWLELQPYLNSSQGMYIFKNADPDFWTHFLKYKKGTNCKVIWEIAADDMLPDNAKKIREIAGELEAFSLNMTEAGSMFGFSDRKRIIAELKSWGLKLIFLRQGAKGAVMITKENVIEVPSQENVNVVDPTGGGNSSTGAVLCGLVEGYSPETCGKMGSISAAMCISQYGVPNSITKEMRKEARKKAGLE